MQAWQATVQDSRGNVIPNPNVSVFEADGITLATVYDGAGVEIDNPIPGSIDGFVQFYAPAGRYKIRAVGGEVWDWINSSEPPAWFEFPSFNASLTANTGGQVRVDYDAQTLPADFTGTLIQYTKKATVRAYGLVTFEPTHFAYDMKRTMHGAHAPGNEIAEMVEAVAVGSGQNGPSNATIAGGFAIAKRGYGSGSANSGEIDGIRVTVRQDGPQGLPAGNSGLSDCAGILVNVQNRGDCGWVAAFEAQTTNAAVGGGVARQVQTKIGVINTNDVTKRSYGFSAVANAGSNHSAFYSLGFDYALFADAGLAIRPSGEHAIITPDWVNGGARFMRGQALNDATTIQGRGANGITITAPEGFVSFATGGTPRMRVASDGHLVPEANNGQNLGASTLRWNNVFSTALNILGGNITLSNLPAYADNAAALAGGLIAGRVYRTPAGDVKVVL